MNPADAEALGVNEGDWVEIESPYGKIRQRAKITPTIKQGICHAMHGWWYPEEDGNVPNLYGNWKSNVNMLMPNSVNGKLGFGNTFKQMMVKLKKADGEGGPNDPDANGIILEPSRQAEFEVQQVSASPKTSPPQSTCRSKGGMTMPQHALYIDFEFCSGCHSCEIACRNDLSCLWKNGA